MILPDRMTLSLCPECYAPIPAAVLVNEGAVEMVKTCGSHGVFTSLVERDAAWWQYCQKANCDNIYDGYFIDITEQCNLKCAYCYHGSGENHRTVEDVVAEAMAYKHLGPLVLTGGEPTIHPDLPTILRRLKGIEVVTLTNGVRLCDEAYLDELCAAGLLIGNVLTISLSFHKESGGRDIELLDLCRRRGLTVGAAIWVVDDVAQMQEALAVYSEYRDVLHILRIKAASNLWNEQKAHNQIFISDMFKWLSANGGFEIMHNTNNIVGYANVMHKGQHVILVSWPTTQNVDLLSINCGPYHRAMDGSINNNLTTFLINEGITKGAINGKAL